MEKNKKLCGVGYLLTMLSGMAVLLAAGFLMVGSAKGCALNNCIVLYGFMMFANQPLAVIVMLFLFAFSMAGVNPVAVAGVGKEMSAESMGILLPVGSIGAIAMTWLISMAADGI